MFIVKVIAVLNPGFPEAWRMVEAGQIAGFAYIWLLVFLVLLCCFVLWRIVPKGYFRKKSRKRPVRLGNGRFRYPRMKTRLLSAILFGAYSSQGRQDRESPRVSQCPCSLSSSAKGFAGIVYDFKFPALDNDISSFLNATGSDLRHFRLNFSNPYRTDFVNPIQPEYVPTTSYAREYAVSIVANLTKEA